MKRVCVHAASGLDSMTSKSGYKQALSNLYLIKDVLAASIRTEKLDSDPILTKFLYNELAPTIMKSLINVSTENENVSLCVKIIKDIVTWGH